MPAMGDLHSIDPLANKFYLLREQRLPYLKKGKLTPWDPWPVDGYRRREDPVYKAAQKVLQDHNEKCVDNYLDRIVILPASAGQKSRSQGGSHGMWLYSMRSPSTLPVRLILWLTPNSKVMVRHGIRSQSLEGFISSWADAAAAHGPDGFCRHYQFWKSIKVSEEWLRTIPKHLHRRVHERWWMVNGFRFLELPFELREMILEFAMGPFAEPFAQAYKKRPNPLTTSNLLTAPNISLALVSKQLKQETVPVLYAHTTFLLHNTVQMKKFFFKRAIPSQTNLVHSRRWICYLELHFNTCDLLSFLGFEMRRNDNPLHQYIRSHSRSRGGDNLRAVLTDNLSLRCLCIRIPHVMEYFRRTTALRTICQKVFCLAFWAGAKDFLRRIPTAEFTGHVDETKKKEWMEELRLERSGILPDPGDLHDWQNQMLMLWYVPIPLIGHTAI